MATPEQLRRQQELNRALREQNNLQNDFLRMTRDYLQEARLAVRAVSDNRKEIQDTERAFTRASEAVRDIRDELREVTSGLRDNNELSRVGNRLRRATNSLTSEYTEFLNNAVGSQEEVNRILNGEITAREALENINSNNIDDQLRLIEIYNEQLLAINEQAESLREVQEQATRINNAMSLFGGVGLSDLAEGFQRGLQRSGFGGIAERLGLDDAVSAARERAASLTEGGARRAGFLDRLKVSSTFAKSMASSLTKALGPAAIIAMLIEKIVEAFKLLDGLSGEVAKNLGISTEEARGLVMASAEAANNTGNLLLTTKDLVQAQLALNNSMGTAIQFSDEFAKDFALIQKRTQLSAEAMNMFATQAIIANTGIKDQFQLVSDVTMNLNKQSGIALSIKEVQEGISQLSNDQLLTNKMNVKAMANQVFQQKLLGISASQLEQTQSNLLNFESSIAAELEAELLTGRQLNLERARAAALAGNQADLAHEIATQVGTIADYEAMNVIQREALAKAFGMSRDELAGMLIDQEKFNSLRKLGLQTVSEAQQSYNKLIDQGLTHQEALNRMRLNGQDDLLAAQLKSNNMQEKMADLSARFTEQFLVLADALMPLVEAIVPPLVNLLKTMGDTIKGFTNLFSGSLVEGLKTILKGMLLPFQVISDVISPFVGDGKRFDLLSPIGLAEGGVVTKPTLSLIGEGGEPEAVVPLSKSQQLGFGSNSETNMLLRELVAAVKQGGDVYIDGAKVGKSLALSTSRMG